MLCAGPSPVKYEGNDPEHEGGAEAWQPDLGDLRPPIAFGRDADPVATGEVDLCREEGRGKAQHRQ